MVLRTKEGFTLIELVIAVALSAVLLTVVYWTYFSINRSIGIATEDQEALETGRVLTQLIKKDVRGISCGRFPLYGVNEEIDGQPAARIEFVTTANPETNKLRLHRIGYALIINDKRERILVRRESENLKDKFDRNARVFEVSRIVYALRVGFFNGTDWTDKWDSEAQAALPKQIRVTVDVLDEKGNIKPFVAEEQIQCVLQ